MRPRSMDIERSFKVDGSGPGTRNQEPLNLDELTKNLCGLKDGHWEKNLTFDLSLISSQRHRILNKLE